MELLDLVKLPVIIGMIFVIQVVKKLLTKKGLGFKDEDDWLWVTLAMGVPMAIIGTGLDGFDKFNFYQFIVDIFSYAAGAVLLYKTYLVGGKKVSDIITTIKG